MRKLDVSKIMMILVAFMGVLELSVGKFIMAGIFFILAFAIYRNGGAGKYADKAMYEKETDAQNLTVEQLYDAFKDMETPIGRCWIGRHKAYTGDVLIWGPNGFKDCIVLGIQKNKAYIRCAARMDNITYPESERERFEAIIDTTDFEVTPARYSFFAGYKMMSVVLLDDIIHLVELLNSGINKVPAVLDPFNLYHYNSYDGIVFDSEGNSILNADYNTDGAILTLRDAYGSEMARVEATEEKDSYKLYADGEEFGSIVKEKSDNDRYVIMTEAGTFTANSFQAVNRAKLSLNYCITKDGETVAYTGCSAKIIFDDLGKTSNMVVCSLDDDYVVLYAAFQLLILNQYSWLR